ncbi:MAG: hypothetical protein LDL44_12550 [Caenispirillum sp.]|nr:hypothetical protein [Caenispirillum sp.]
MSRAVVMDELLELAGRVRIEPEQGGPFTHSGLTLVADDIMQSAIALIAHARARQTGRACPHGCLGCRRRLGAVAAAEEAAAEALFLLAACRQIEAAGETA